MEEKEIQLININPTDVIREYETKLQDPNLPLIKRKTYETYLKNYELRNMNMQEKQDLIIKENKEKQDVVSKEQLKKKKKQTLTPKKIMIAAAFTTLVATTTFTGFKIYNRYQRLNTLNSYDKIYTAYEIESGDTLYSIAQKLYEKYPEEVKQYLTVDDLVSEIQHINHITNMDLIKYGTNIHVPNKYIPKEGLEENTKNK